MSELGVLERGVPLSKEVLEGLARGIMKIHGGTVRFSKGEEGAGQIVKHLIFPAGEDNVKEAVNELLKATEAMRQENSAQFTALSNELASVQKNILLTGGINIVATAASTAYLAKKINEVMEGVKKILSEVEKLSQSLDFMQEQNYSVVFANSQSAIEDLIYVLEHEDSSSSIRHRISRAREVFNQIDHLINLMIEKGNECVVDNMDVFFSLVEWLNYIGLAMAKAHEYLDEGQRSLERVVLLNNTNKKIKDVLVQLKASGSFSPHILTDNQFSILKDYLGKNVAVRETVLRIEHERAYCLEHDINLIDFQALSSKHFLMLD